jgi:hypothetical protein
LQLVLQLLARARRFGGEVRGIRPAGRQLDGLLQRRAIARKRLEQVEMRVDFDDRVEGVPALLALDQVERRAPRELPLVAASHRLECQSHQPDLVERV